MIKNVPHMEDLKMFFKQILILRENIYKLKLQ